MQWCQRYFNTCLLWDRAQSGTDGDEEAYVKLVQDLFVVETQRIPSSLNHSFAQSHSQSEIVGRAVAWLVRTSSPSVLAFGYRPLKQNQQGSRSAHLRGIQCVFPNTITNFLKSPPWEVLISRIGDDAMYTCSRARCSSCNRRMGVTCSSAVHLSRKRYIAMDAHSSVTLLHLMHQSLLIDLECST